MGPKASTVQNTDENTVKINHPIFALSKLIKGKQDEDLIQTQARLANKNQFKAWQKRLTELQQNDSLMTPFAKQYQEEGICGSSGIALITYQNFPYLLSDEISNRQSLQKKLFEENELWYLVYTLLSAASTYHQKGVKVGDIRPDNIFINQDGQVKVASIDSWPGQQTNYAKSFYEKQSTYLSPQQIKDYQFGKMQQSGDKVLAQTFSIGLTCLDAATLSNSKDLYTKNFKFSYEKLESKLSQFSKIGYSQLLTLTIQNMCEVDTQFRSSSRQILKWLLPHEEAIVNLEDFQVNGLPQKMRLARQRNLSGATQITTPQSNHTSMYQQAVNVVPVHTTLPVSQPLQNVGINIPQYYQPQNQFSNINYQPVKFTGTTSTIPSTTIQGISSTNYANSTLPSTNFQYVPSQHISTTYVSSNQQLLSQNIGTPSQLLSQGMTQGYTNYQVGNLTVNAKDQTHKSMLDKIDQQLQQSRKMFPSS